MSENTTTVPPAELVEQYARIFEAGMRMKRSQHLSHGVSAAAHAVKSGDSHGSGSSINLSESDRS